MTRLRSSDTPNAAHFDYSAARERMVRRQIAQRGVTDPEVLDAMRSVPREQFVPPHLQASAYDDVPLPIGSGQTISQPYIVAAMIEAAMLSGTQRVLEIGAGSGYAAAVMSRIAGHVYAVERHEALARDARRRLKELGFQNVTIKTADGTRGWPKHAPFDAILVAAAGQRIPPALQQQLAVGGRLIMPVASGEQSQTLRRAIRKADGSWPEEDLGSVVFVPLIGDCA